MIGRPRWCKGSVIGDVIVRCDGSPVNGTGHLIQGRGADPLWLLVVSSRSAAGTGIALALGKRSLF